MSSYNQGAINQQAIGQEQQQPSNYQPGFLKDTIIMSCALTQAINGVITIFSEETSCIIGGLIQLFAGIFVFLVESPLFLRCMAPVGSRKGCSFLTYKPVPFKTILYSILAVASIASGCLKLAYIVEFLAALGIAATYGLTWVGKILCVMIGETY